MSLFSFSLFFPMLQMQNISVVSNLLYHPHPTKAQYLTAVQHITYVHIFKDNWRLGNTYLYQVLGPPNLSIHLQSNVFMIVFNTWLIVWPSVSLLMFHQYQIILDMYSVYVLTVRFELVMCFQWSQGTFASCLQWYFSAERVAWKCCV